MSVNIIFGGNAGSEGKGKFAGFLAKKNQYNHVISNFFPNAGHTWVSKNGTKIITRLLPSSLVNENTQLYIGPGACLDMEVLMDEIRVVEEEGFNVTNRLHIHPRAAIIDDSHIEMEKKQKLERIGSTLKGGSAGIALKAMRSESQKLAKDEESLSSYIYNTEMLLKEAMTRGESILIEGAQGFELDINYGYKYPYTTSRQTTPSQLLADCGLPVKAVKNIYCVLRPYPIRVADPEKEGETSGALAGKEIKWSEVEERAGAPGEVH
ncbi:adenylosuccinate synthetase [Halobacillus seohaensis]|uniref:Adenylosuccinate synthetase n=1 Tax=Halobacillus seohaensis TaxID=447421 RepID=A0ABW2EPT5_9BACI